MSHQVTVRAYRVLRPAQFQQQHPHQRLGVELDFGQKRTRSRSPVGPLIRANLFTAQLVLASHWMLLFLLLLLYRIFSEASDLNVKESAYKGELAGPARFLVSVSFAHGPTWSYMELFVVDCRHRRH